MSGQGPTSKNVFESAAIQELRDFGQHNGVTQGLYWPTSIFREIEMRKCRPNRAIRGRRRRWEKRRVLSGWRQTCEC